MKQTTIATVSFFSLLIPGCAPSNSGHSMSASEEARTGDKVASSRDQSSDPTDYQEDKGAAKNSEEGNRMSGYQGDSGKEAQPGPFKFIDLNSFEEFRNFYMDPQAFYLGHDETWHYANTISHSGVARIRKEKITKEAFEKTESEKKAKKYPLVQLPFVKPTKEELDWYNNAKLSKDW
jgi:hypothetical protein